MLGILGSLQGRESKSWAYRGSLLDVEALRQDVGKLFTHQPDITQRSILCSPDHLGLQFSTPRSDVSHSCSFRLAGAYRGSLLDIEALGQHVGDGDDAHEVVHVTADAARHARVLDFEHHSLAIMQHGSMHLVQASTLVIILVAPRLLVELTRPFQAYQGNCPLPLVQHGSVHPAVCFDGISKPYLAYKGHHLLPIVQHGSIHLAAQHLPAHVTWSSPVRHILSIAHCLSCHEAPCTWQRSLSLSLRTTSGQKAWPGSVSKSQPASRHIRIA